MVNFIVVLWFLALLAVTYTSIAIFYKIYKKKQSAIKVIYIKYGIKVNAYILE